MGATFLSMSGKGSSKTIHATTDQVIGPLSKPLPEPVVLVGIMGSGKTTIGRRLAKRLGLQFYDSDAVIEKEAGISISEIFAAQGEEAFREMERNVIAELLSSPDPIILATGGGAFVEDSTRELILDKAIALWLHASLDVLLERVSRRNHRPLLRQGDKKEILMNLLKQREPFYEQAHMHVRSGEGSHNKVVNAIIYGLDQWVKEHDNA